MAIELQAFISVALYLKSRDLTAEGIAERLGLDPTRMQKKGEPPTVPIILQEDGSPVDLRPPRSPFHYFVLEVERMVDKSSDDSAAKDLEAVLDELLAKVEPVSDRLAQLGNKVSANLICSCTHRNTIEWLRLSAHMLQRIVALNLPLMMCLVPLEKREKPPSS